MFNILLLYVILLICLFFIFIEDFKNREVHILYFTGVLVSSLYIFFDENGVLNNLYNSFLFLLLNLISLKTIMVLKQKNKNNDFFFGGLALGDIVFYIIVIPLFSFTNYMFFFITGTFFSLLAHKITRFFQLGKDDTVPLAGFLSFYLITILIFNVFFKLNFYLRFF